MNEMAGRFLTYEANIGEDMVSRRSRGYSGLCEIDEHDGQWGIFQLAAGDPATPRRLSADRCRQKVRKAYLRAVLA